MPPLPSLLLPTAHALLFTKHEVALERHQLDTQKWGFMMKPSSNRSRRTMIDSDDEVEDDLRDDLKETYDAVFGEDSDGKEALQFFAPEGCNRLSESRQEKYDQKLEKWNGTCMVRQRNEKGKG